MKSWKPLKEGDIVDVVAPGFATAPEVVDGARRFLLGWGLIPRLPSDLIGSHFLHSNDDEVRFDHLKKALLAKDSAAVWCLRGGYGANRLLPKLAKLKAPPSPKLFVGISDVTSLHVFLQQKWGWRVVHGPLLDRLALGKIAPKFQSELHDLVFGRSAAVEFRGLKPLNAAAKSGKTLKAPIVGGNLVTLQSTLGTPWQLDLKGKILFVEELGERGYRVDRIFEHFAQAGVMKGCRGVLIGDFLGGNEVDGRNLVQGVIERWADQLKIPVYQGLEAGHGDVQRPVPFGVTAELSGKPFRLRIPSGASRLGASK